MTIFFYYIIAVPKRNSAKGFSFRTYKNERRETSFMVFLQWRRGFYVYNNFFFANYTCGEFLQNSPAALGLYFCQIAKRASQNGSSGFHSHFNLFLRDPQYVSATLKYSFRVAINWVQFKLESNMKKRIESKENTIDKLRTIRAVTLILKTATLAPYYRISCIRWKTPLPHRNSMNFHFTTKYVMPSW